ncbi:MAG TPA: hypothetical protein VM659_17395 [Dongiaceae bacterium]|nr:hypothetical protein [Dongiaceae bacterium]
MFPVRLLFFVTMALLTVGRAATAADMSDACADLRHDAAGIRGAALLLPSFPGAEPGPLYKAAFLYDNAVAVIALAGCDDLADARRIGDALVYAQSHDRFWQDGRLRNAYRAGFIGDDKIKLAGWWDTDRNQWLEDRYQAGSDSGNLAWAMLALLTLDRLNPDTPRYRDSAVRIGTWLRQWRDDDKAATAPAGDPGGFRGGTFGHEPDPEIVRWKSTEHNTDLAAAFARLAVATGDATWKEDAKAARNLVAAMWQPEAGCFATGTADDGISRNDFEALDAQIWPLLALADAPRYRAAVMTRCLPKLRQGQGYAYSAALHGIWTEGTAQAALLMACTGRPDDAADDARELMQTLATLHAPGGGFYATDQAQLPTGFILPTTPGAQRFYFHQSHLGATAWVALAQRKIDPFAFGEACPGTTN